jgi:hypothetical protein
MPANSDVSAQMVCSGFQEIYPGCCTVAAHDQKMLEARAVDFRVTPT